MTPWPPALPFLVGGLFICLLVFLPSSILWAERFTLPKEVVLHAAAGAAALSCLMRARRLRFDAIDTLIGSFLGLGLLSTLLVAVNPWFAGRSIAVMVSGALVFWSARTLAEEGHGDRLLMGSMLAVGALASTMLLEAYGVLDGLSTHGRSPGGTIGNRNRAAHLLVVALPVLWLCIVQARRHLSLSLLLALTAASTTAIVLARSRAAWLAMLLLTVGAAAAWPLIRRKETKWSVRTATFVGAAAFGAMVAIFAPNTLAWTSATPYTDTLQRLTDYETGSGRGRVIQYANTLRMVREHALLGVGPGNWTVAYPRYASPGDPSFLPHFLRPTNLLPHGSWIAIAAEWGLPALLLLGLAACLLATSARRSIRSAESPDGRCRGIVLLCVLAALLVLGAFDPVLQLPAMMFLVALVVGALVPARCPTRAFPVGGRMRSIAVGFLATLMLISSLQSGRRIYAAHLVGSWSLRHESPFRLERAARIDPANYEAHVLLGAFWIRQGRCDLALPPLRRAARLFPTASPIPELRARCWQSDRAGEAASATRGRTHGAEAHQ